MFVDKMCLLNEIPCVPRENKRFGKPTLGLFCPKIKLIPHNFPLVTLKCCCSPGILGKHTKFVTFFVCTIDEIPPFSQSWRLALTWRTVTTRACLLLFSALNDNCRILHSLHTMLNCTFIRLFKPLIHFPTLTHTHTISTELSQECWIS